MDSKIGEGNLIFPLWPDLRKNANLRIVMFPHSGGHLYIYNKWSKQLPLFVDVVSVEYPGRGVLAAEPFEPNPDILIAKIVNSLKAFADSPLVFWGHSLGAIIAFKVACQIQNDPKYKLLKIFLSAKEPPRGSTTYEFGSNLSDEKLIEKVISMGAMPKEILDCSSTKNYMLKVLRHDFMINDTIKINNSDRLSVKVTLMVGESDPFVSISNLLKWQQYCSNIEKCYTFKGGHFYYIDDEIEFKTALRSELEMELKLL